MPINILCVDDQVDTLHAIQLLLQLEGYATATATTAKDAMISIERNHYDAIILDTGLPDESGIDLCAWIRANNAVVPIIVYSGHSDTSDIERAKAAGATEYLIKPADFDDIVGTIRELTESLSTRTEKR